METKVKHETQAYEGILRQIEHEHQARLDSLMVTMSQNEKMRLSRKYQKLTAKGSIRDSRNDMQIKAQTFEGRASSI